MNNSIDVSSNESETLHENNTPVMGENVAVLQTMASLDDVDDDEAFISELMAMHPNDEDIVVEDLEAEGDDLLTLHEGLWATGGLRVKKILKEPSENLTTPEPKPDDDDGDGVRIQKRSFLYRCSSLLVVCSPPYAHKMSCFSERG